MKKPGPLSPSQFRLLCELHRDGQKHVVEYYAPAKKLVELGLARWVRTDQMAITDQGRKVIDAGGPT